MKGAARQVLRIGALVVLLFTALSGVEWLLAAYPDAAKITLFALSAGLAAWLIDEILPSKPPKKKWSAEVVRAHMVRPCLVANGLDVPLRLNQQTLDMALDKLAAQESWGFSIVKEDGTEIEAIYPENGIELIVREPESGHSLHPVPRDHALAGSVFQNSFWRSLFGKVPYTRYGKMAAREILHGLLGWGEQPADLGWVRVAYR